MMMQQTIFPFIIQKNQMVSQLLTSSMPSLTALEQPSEVLSGTPVLPDHQPEDVRDSQHRSEPLGDTSLLRARKRPRVEPLARKSTSAAPPVLTSVTFQIPTTGLFLHHNTSGDNCWSDISSRLIDSDRSHYAVICFGRQASVLQISTMVEVSEMLHPQLLRHGLHLWVSKPVAHFSSDLLAGHPDVFRKIDLLFLYQQMLHLRSQIAANKSRVLNAYEEGMLTENLVQQTWCPNPVYFSRSRGYIPYDTAASISEQSYQFVLSNFSDRYPNVAFADATCAPIRRALQFLIIALNRHSAISALVENFELIFGMDQQPTAVYVSLEPPTWRSDNVQIVEYFGFGQHLCSGNGLSCFGWVCSTLSLWHWWPCMGGSKYVLCSRSYVWIWCQFYYCPCSSSCGPNS